VLVRWLLVASLAAFLGAVAWAVARFGLEKADQTASVVGGSVALLSLPISLYALRAPGGTEGAGPAAGGTPAAREWVPTAAVSASLRPPMPTAPVRGRNEELAVLDRLRRGGGMAVVCGAGGLGKTTLAAQAAHQAQQAGMAVFWIRWQDDPHRLAEDLTRIAQALGLTEQRLEAARRGQAVLVDVVWEQLAAVSGWVVIVDNVDTPARVGPGQEAVAAYRGWLRPDGAGLLMVTSRDTAVGTWGRRAQVLNLEPLEETAAAAVLIDTAPSAGSETEARALAVRLGGLPLALEAAGRFLATATSEHTLGGLVTRQPRLHTVPSRRAQGQVRRPLKTMCNHTAVWLRVGYGLTVTETALALLHNARPGAQQRDSTLPWPRPRSSRAGSPVRPRGDRRDPVGRRSSGQPRR
jgi:hypothetical protein